MKVLVDTCIWSLALRKRPKTPEEQRVILQLEQLIHDLRAALIGPIRQELLSGIREETQFAKVRDRLRAFPDLPLHTETYEQAARLHNTCRRRGIQGSNTDFLLCAAAKRHDLAIFTVDRDFDHFTRILGTRLFRG